ncbi:maleylpyruvate isomerase family mycothiol-dependent enzyme [Streptomyces sp. NPDC093225]|uniref:maleylpyruvate isomerase family mycothiol-dependent enzyme n=1 Tax=Streptomyces sp. NPDC093225 TaxID=3366034 RepID=UPI00380DA7D0
MTTNLDLPTLLRLIDERSTAFRAAIAAAPDLDAQVPTCPEWTLFDLAQHLGEGRRKWAGIVAAGPADAPPAASGPAGAPTPPREREALVAWLAASTQLLLDALREAGPDRGCWTWWGDSQSPQTCGAVARHQLQEVAVHTYDAQITVGAPQPLPDEVALDGVDEFLTTCCATTAAWPHEPATVDYHAAEGRSWRLRLSADGARVTAPPTPATDPDATDASARGAAADLVLAFYGRVPVDSLKLDGDRHVFDRLVAWEPDV